MSLYLCHHGILGQKWGVRRYQNPDGTLTEAGRIRLKGSERKSMLVDEQLGIKINKNKFNDHDKNESKSLKLKKGDKVYHVTPKEFNKLNDGQDLFISATDRDRNMYKSFLSLMMRHKGFDKKSIKEVEFELKKDLNAPSNNKQKDIFNKVYKENKKVFDDELKQYYSKDATLPKDKYDAFIKTLDKSGKSKTYFYNELKNNGYNAVLDQHDVTGSWMQASQPLIVMDAINTLGNIKVIDINDEEINRSLKELGYI